MSVMVFVFMVLTVSLVSAGFFEDLFGKITGKATTKATNVSISVTGINAVTIVVINSTITGTTNDPSEDTFSTIEFFVEVSDADGVNDINDSSVNVSVAFFNQSLFSSKRVNLTCSLVADLDANKANFSCSIYMYYFDANGIWNITVFANDLGNLTAQSDTTKDFTYDQLKAIKITPTALTFASVSPGDTNITSNNDRTYINDTGNFNGTSGGIEINATNLIGVTTHTDSIPVANFSISIVDSTGPPANESCITQTTPVNATSTAITGSILPRGNNSLNNNVTGQEIIFYCITQVPTDISSQTYSSAKSDNGYGAWTILMV